MLLVQIALLILGILCPVEIRLAYFTHILFLCLYLLATNKFKHLIYLIILLISLLFNGFFETTKSPVIANNSYLIEIEKIKQNDAFGFSVYTNHFIDPDTKLPLQASGQKWALDIRFEQNAVSHNNTSSDVIYQDNHLIKVQVQSTLNADKDGEWLQRKLYREGFEGLATLRVLDWTEAHKGVLESLPQPVLSSVLQRLDALYASFPSWPYSKALIFGVTTDLQQKQIWLIRTLGLVHLFVVSGLHMGFVYLLVRFVVNAVWMILPSGVLGVRANKSFFALFLLLPISLFYALLTGWGESVQRAVLMLLLWQVFSLGGIKLSAFKILWLSLYLILLMDFTVIESPGLWLSFCLVFLLLLYYVGSKRHIFQTIKLQFILTLCVTALILGWQTYLSSVSALINFLLLPFVAMIWFPFALIESLIGWFFDLPIIMPWLDYMVLAVLSILEKIALWMPVILLQQEVPLSVKVICYFLCLAWVLYRQVRLAWVVFPLVLMLLIFSDVLPLTHNQFNQRHTVTIENKAGDANVMVDQTVKVSSAWVNHGSEMSLMWLDPYLESSALGKERLTRARIMMWPKANSALSSALLHRFSPNTLILTQSPKADVVALLQAMKVNWLVLGQGARMKFEFWRNQWVIKHSNCLIFLISSQEKTCTRVAKLESVLNYSPKL